jgi:hypothetical protein
MATEDAPSEGGDTNRPMWSMLNEESSAARSRTTARGSSRVG